MRKTRDEIEHLKACWRADPIWDVETTEGFEVHQEELLAFRKEQEAAWESKAKEELEAFAAEIGVGLNFKLAMYLNQVMRRIQALEEELGRMKEGR